MRPLSPLPRTEPRLTPSSRANLRTEGDACAAPKLASSIAGSERVGNACWTPCGAAGRGAADGTAVADAGGGAGAGAAAAAAANPFTVTTTEPGETLPPLATCT